MSLSKLVSDNYEYLNTVAKRITRCKNVRMAPDLLSETYSNLAEKETDLPQDNNEFVKFFCKCMKNYFQWPNSSFNRLHFPKECTSLDADFNTVTHDGESKRKGVLFTGRSSRASNRFDELLVDEDALTIIEIQVEGTNDFTKELIEISSSMGKVKTLKYIELVEFKRSLPAHELILFELYYEKELSTRKIAEMYSDGVHKMNYQSVNQMVNNIKSKLKSYQWKS